MAANWELLYAVNVLFYAMAGFLGLVTAVLYIGGTRVGCLTNIGAGILAVIASLDSVVTLIAIIAAMTQRLPSLHVYASNWAFFGVMMVVCGILVILSQIANFFTLLAEKIGTLSVGVVVGSILGGFSAIFGTLFFIGVVSALLQL